MPSSFHGADAVQLRAFAREAFATSATLRQVEARLTTSLAALAWRGPDADRARRAWETDHAFALRRTSAVLVAVRMQILAEAGDQENASSAAGGAGSTVAPVAAQASVAGTPAALGGRPAAVPANPIAGAFSDLGKISTAETVASTVVGGVGHGTIAESATAIDELRSAVPAVGKVADSLGVLGVTASAYETYQKYEAEGVLGAALPGISTGIGAASVLSGNPVVAAVGVAWDGGTAVGTGISNSMQGTYFGDRFEAHMEQPFKAAGALGMINTPGALFEAGFDTVTAWMTNFLPKPMAGPQVGGGS